MNRLPLHLIRAFEAVARNRSFTRAAEELCITQAAVSQQIKLLEESIGVDLFDRASRKIALTRSGEILLPAVRNALHSLSDATAQIKALQSNRQISIKVSPFLLRHWLGSRLHRFESAHPAVDVRVRHFYQSLSPEAFARDGVDLVVAWGEGSWPGLISEMLFRLELTLVCSPSVLRPSAESSEPVNLGQYTLLRSFYDWWDDWSKATGTKLDLQSQRYVYDTNQLIEAALDGHGIALVPVSLGVAEHLASGRLVRASDVTIETNEAYYVVSSGEALRRPGVTHFREWLLEESMLERSKYAGRSSRAEEQLRASR
ncbi:MAG: LysR substrate-binding domain-containing protein [Dongiaceae bacterium]